MDQNGKPVWAVGGQGELQGVYQLQSKLETWFFKPLGFWVWQIIWDNFQRPMMDLNGKNSLYRL